MIAFEAAANRSPRPTTSPSSPPAACDRARPGWSAATTPCFLTEWPFRSEDHWPAVREVSCPALLVRAEDSFVLSADVAEAEAEALGGELVEIGPAAIW